MDVANLRVLFTAEGDRNVTGAVDRVNRGLDSVEGHAKRGGSALGTMFSTAGGFILANTIQRVTQEIGGLVSGALDFGAQMANVNSIAQLTDAQLKTLSASVNSLAGQTAQAPQVLAAGLYEIYSSGFQGAEALTVLEASANAATAGLTTTDVAAKAITAVMNAYGQETYTAAQVSDVLFQTVNEGVLSFDQLSKNLGNTLPAANALGVSIYELGAAYAQMTLRGVSASLAETQIASLMKSAANPTEALTAATQAYGFETTQALLAAEGMPGLLAAIDQAAQGDTKALYAMLGTQEAVNAAMILGEDGASAYNEALERMEKSAGATEKALSKQMESASFKMRLARIAVQQAATAFIGVLSPAIAAGAQGFTFLVLEGLVPAVDWFGRVVDIGSRFASLLREVFGSGQGVEDLFNVLFGPGAEFANAPELIKDVARELLNISDALGDMWAAYRSGGLSGLGDVLVEEVSNIVDSLGTIAGGVVNVVVDTVVSIIGDIKTLAEKGWQAFVNYAGHGESRDGTAGPPAPFDTVDVLIDGTVKLMGDLSDLAGAIARELGLMRSPEQLAAAEESGYQAGLDFAEAVRRGMDRGAEDGGDADAPGGGGAGFMAMVRKLLTWEPKFLDADQATFIDAFILWYANFGKALEDETMSALEGMREGGWIGRVNAWAEGVNRDIDLAILKIVAELFKIPGKITDALGIEDPSVPDWLDPPDWITGPIDTLALGISTSANTLKLALDLLEAQKNRLPGMGGGDDSATAGGMVVGSDSGPFGTAMPGDESFIGPVLQPSVDIQTVVKSVDWSLVTDALNPFGAGFGDGGDSQFSGMAFTATIDADTGPFDLAKSAVDVIARDWDVATFASDFDADHGPAALKYTDVMTWGGIWADSIHEATFDADNGPAAIAYTNAFGWGATWDAQVFTATFSIDTSGLSAARDAAYYTAQYIRDIMPNSPAKIGPLAGATPSLDYIADSFRASFDRMRAEADTGMAGMRGAMNGRGGSSGRGANGRGGFTNYGPTYVYPASGDVQREWTSARVGEWRDG